MSDDKLIPIKDVVKHVKDACEGVDQGKPITYDRYKKKVMSLTMKHTREELNRKLLKAIEDGDSDKMAPFADAIDLDNEYQRMIRRLPPDQTEELITYAKNRIKKEKKKVEG